jgi:hypothetical protein
LLDQTYPEKALHILKEHPEVDFVHANELYDDAMIGEFVMRPLRKQNNLYPNIGKGMPYRHQTMVVRKTVYEKVGLFDLKYATSDYDWICKWELSLNKSHGKAYYSQGNPVIKMDGGGISSTQESKIILEAIQIIIQRNRNVGFLEKTKSYSALMNRLVLFYGRFLLKTLGFENILVKVKRIKYQSFLAIK